MTELQAPGYHRDSTRASVGSGDHIEAFRAEMREHGIEPPPRIIDDGKIHRFGTNGKPNDDAGWYLIHTDGIPAGAFGDWRSVETITWCSRDLDTLSEYERREHKARVRAAEEERRAEQEQRHAEAAKRAQAFWEGAEAAPVDHLYLKSKNIKAHGMRMHEGKLVIPIRIDDSITSLQFIDETGSKRTYSGGKITGGYHILGEVKPRKPLCIAEGFSTAATIHEATGYPVAIAFNAGNLHPVAQALKAQHSNCRFIVCADDDHSTEGNPGLTKARKAAEAIGGHLVKPDFGLNRPDAATDFNDLAQHRSMDAVKEQVKPPMVELINAVDVQPERIDWLWEGWLAKGKLHILAGAPGTGKTNIALLMAATVSTGGTWPDGTRSPAGNVVICSMEDGIADTLVPRLIALGANMDRIRFCPLNFDPAKEIPKLEDTMAGQPPALMVLDPIVSAVTADSHKNAEVRRDLQSVVDFGQRLGCAVVGITHFTKGSKGADPLDRVTGSLAFGALARLVFCCARRSDENGGTRLLVRAKSNIGPDGNGFEFDLEITDVEGIAVIRPAWGSLIEGNARDLLAQAEQSQDPEERSALDEATDWLSEALAGGPRLIDELKKDAEQLSIAWRTVERARAALGVKLRKPLGEKGRWALPDTTQGAYFANDPLFRQDSRTGKHGEIGNFGEIDTSLLDTGGPSSPVESVESVDPSRAQSRQTENEGTTDATDSTDATGYIAHHRLPAATGWSEVIS